VNASIEELRTAATWERKTGLPDWRAWLERLRRAEAGADTRWDAEDATGGFRVGGLTGAVGREGLFADFDEDMDLDAGMALARRVLESASGASTGHSPHVTYDMRVLYDLPARWHGPLRRLTSAARLDPWVTPGVVTQMVGLQYYLAHESGRVQIRLDLVPEWIRPDVLLVRLHAFDERADPPGVATLAEAVTRVLEVDVPRLVMLADR
jgi:hypothetical protein